MILYPYVGPREIRQNAMNTARFRIQSAADIWKWAQTQELRRDDPLWATFIVDKSGALWLADRRSEHIGCSRGQDVQAAGELALEPRPNTTQVLEATNQSTGFCPPVESWTALARALEEVGLAHPSSWTTAFEFRRCLACGATNLIKDEWFWCAQCDAELPQEWNFRTS